MKHLKLFRHGENADIISMIFMVKELELLKCFHCGQPYHLDEYSQKKRMVCSGCGMEMGSANRRENKRKGYKRALHSIGIFYNHRAFGSAGRYYDGAWVELLGGLCDYRWNHLFVGKIFTGKYRITEIGEYLPIEVVPEYYNKECVTNFDRLVIDAINELPQNLKDRLSNVSVVVEDKPSSSVLGKLRLLPNTMLMGLFQGVPLNKKAYGIPVHCQKGLRYIKKISKPSVVQKKKLSGG